MTHSNPHRSHLIRGVLSILGAVFLFSTGNAVVKDVAATYSIIQVVFFRFFFAVLATVAVMALQQKRRGDSLRMTDFVDTKRPGLLVLSGVLTFVGIMSLFKSFSLLPLSDGTALSFTTILFTTLLSPLILKESVNVRKWIAILLGFVGVIIMARPSGNIPLMGLMFALCFGLNDSIVMLLTRILTRTDVSQHVVLGICLIATFLAALCLPFVWIPMSLIDTGKFLFLGITGGLGQYFLTEAYRLAPPSLIAPMIYSGMIWGLLFGYLFWGDIPDAVLLMGACCIIGSGIWIISLDLKNR